MNFDLVKLSKTASVLFLALAMAGCGGSRDTADSAPPAPTVNPVDLAGVTAGAIEGAMAGTLEVAAGMSGEIGNITFSCAAGGDDCAIAVAVDADDGTVSATSTGGMATAATSNAYVTGLENSRERARLYGVVSSRRAAAIGAAKAAVQAVKDAVKYVDELTTFASKGESMTAQMNAQNVLDARTTTMESVTAAKDAMTALEMAETEAMALPDDADRAALITAIGEAMTEVEEQIEMAEAQVDDETLATSVRRIEYPDYEVNGNGVVTKGEKRGAAYHGEKVAMVIGMAIDLPEPTFGTAGFPPDPAATNVVNMEEDRIGMTFADIVGEDNLMSMRIDRPAGDADAGAGTVQVMAAAFDNMNLAALDTAPTRADVDVDVDVDDGDQFGGMYKGIAGTIFCAGSDCKIAGATEEDDGVADNGLEVNTSSALTGSWYFAPGDAKETYTKAGTATVYSQEMDFVQFGYWFNTDAAGTDAAGALAGNINVIAAIPTDRATDGDPDVDTSANETNELAGSATYSGTALGLSVYKPDDDDDGEHDSISSGAFTADVSLAAQFGSTDRTLSGTVTNFEGNAVNSSWTAYLDEALLSEAGVIPNTSTTNAEVALAPVGGTWTAIGEGATDERPAVFYGIFDAHWVDGDAAGGYSTRKDD